MSGHHFQLHTDKITISTKGEFSETFPAGVYTIEASMDGVFFTKVKIVSDQVIPVANSPVADIINDIAHFMKPEIKAKYKEYGFVHKRGVLMHGKGGTGKSTTIKQIVESVVNDGGIVFFNANPKLLAAVLPLIREKSPEALICVVYEEFDEWVGRDASSMLSFLDGELQVEDIVFLAATNYISKIPERIKNRPSRFAKVVELHAPDENFRREFLKRKLKGDDLLRLEEFVEATDGFVVDQLKDVVISVCCVGTSLHEAVNKLKEMSEKGVGIDDYVETSTKRELDRFTKDIIDLQRDFGLKKLGVKLLEFNDERDN